MIWCRGNLSNRTPTGHAGQPVGRSAASRGTRFTVPARFAVADTRRIERPARQPNGAKRAAAVEMRFGEEGRPNPEAAEPLHWRLRISHAIDHAAQAWQAVAWYRARRTSLRIGGRWAIRDARASWRPAAIISTIRRTLGAAFRRVSQHASSTDERKYGQARRWDLLSRMCSAFPLRRQIFAGGAKLKSGS